MSRRSKLVYLLSLNAILASAIVALVTLLVASSQPPYRASVCAPDAGQSTLPASDALGSVAEAEAFICHDVAYPRDTGPLELEQISASRSGPAASVGRGLGFASVTLDYALPGNEGADLRIEVSPFRIDPVLYGIVDRVEIMGAEANVIQGKDPSLFIVQWEANGFSFYTEARLAASFGLPDLYTILNSIR